MSIPYVVSRSPQYWTPAVILALLLLAGCGDVGTRIERILGRGASQPSGSTEEEGPTADELMLLVVDAINSRDYLAAQEALDEFKNCPGYNEFWAIYAEAFLVNRLGLYREALNLVDYLSPGRFQSELLSLRGEIYLAMHRYNEARRDLEDARLAGGGNEEFVLYALWELALSEGRMADARGLISELSKRQAVDQYAALAVFDRSLLLRDFVGATEALDRLAGVPMVGEAGEDVALHYDPLILQARARLAVARGDIDRAVDVLLATASENPHVTSVWPTLAWIALDAGRIERARLWSIEGLVRCGGADILAELDIDVPESLAEPTPPPGPLRHAEAAKLLVTLAHAVLAQGGANESLELAAKALEVNRYEEEAFLLRSRAYEILGETVAALAEAREGLRMDPYDDSLALRYVVLARRVPLAMVATDPDPEPILADLMGECRARHEEYPDDPAYSYALGKVMQLAGDGAAVDLFATAYETAPHRINLALEFAASMARTGDLQGERDILEDLDLPPDLPWLAESYLVAAETVSEGLLDLTDWVRQRMDQENRFGATLDTLAEAARDACQTAASEPSP